MGSEMCIRDSARAIRHSSGPGQCSTDSIVLNCKPIRSDFSNFFSSLSFRMRRPTVLAFGKRSQCNYALYVPDPRSDELSRRISSTWNSYGRWHNDTARCCSTFLDVKYWGTRLPRNCIGPAVQLCWAFALILLQCALRAGNNSCGRCRVFTVFSLWIGRWGYHTIITTLTNQMT